MSTLSPNLSVYTDGASRSNPGHAACAYLVGVEGKDPFKAHQQYLGDKVTNNQAEYRGMALALAYLVELVASSPVEAFGHITVHSDSQLVVEQTNGTWKVRNADLKAPCQECQNHLRTLRERGYTVVLR